MTPRQQHPQDVARLDEARRIGEARRAEERRLAVMRQYHLLDPPPAASAPDTGAPPSDAAPDADLTAVVNLVVAVTGTSYAAVNLIDDEYHCEIATTGPATSRSLRADSLCASHFLAGELVHVPDAGAHPDYADNPWVDGRLARVRSYTSAPLVTADGTVLGSLCAVDTRPHRLDDDQLARFADLARLVVSIFERRREARRLVHLAQETEEQRALLAMVLEEAEARQELTEAVLDTIDVAVVACDPQGRLTLFNRAAHEWHGSYPDAAVPIGEHPRHYRLFEADGTTPLGPARVPLRRALAEGRVEGAEVVIAPGHREPIAATVSGRSLLRLDGSVLGAVVAMSDVTADRARREELLTSNTDLERFAAVAGHDLAAPLGVISGYLELLVDEHGDRLDAQARGWIATVQGGVGRMQALISSLLAHARSGGPVSDPRPTDLDAVLDLALADLAGEVSSADASVTSEGLPVVLGDPVLLRQLLQNLVGNAVKHRDPDRPCRVVVSARRADAASWEVSVADAGTGVPEDQREAVFGMFTALDPASHRGHGIGLATCRRIVERHGGTIRVVETPGGGATFRFTLPAVPAR